jgi:predicted TIM-barrel fold metal-dependent hydrolase
VEYIFDTTRAIVNLLYEGTLRRYPACRIVFSHAGGTVPFLTHRISGMEHTSNVPDVVGTLRSLYYDVASAMAPYALRSLQELADPTHIVWGSDLPFIRGQRLRDEVDEWEAYDGFDAATRAGVERENALRLFPRLAARSPVG